jgi:D-alanine-D-alanine ligase
MGRSEPDAKVRLLVLYGGRSAEHEISCISALHVVNAVDADRYDLGLVGITTNGEWVEASAAIGSGEVAGGPRALPSPDTMMSTGPALERVAALAERDTSGATGPLVVLPLLHGPMGEDGTIQGLLEVAGVPYCGAGVAGSAAAMDKGLAKSILAAAGLPQARYVSVRETDVDGSLVDRVEADLGWPVFVKPANMGSSIGITRVKDPGGLLPALDVVARYDEFAVIEEAINGRELEIGVLGWPDLRASVPGEIKPSRDFYDFDDKYVDGAAGLEVPAQVPDGVAEEMASLSISACRAMRIDCMARVDFFFEEGGRGLLINEINTVPGFTPISMYPRMWAASGVPYGQLVDELVDQALRRADRRSRFETHRP